MKRNIYFILASIFIASMAFISCDKEETPDDNGNGNNNNSKTGIHHYFTAASYGDIISLTIDRNNSTYSFINETTGESGSGTLKLSSNPKLSGVFETTIEGKTQYTIELPGIAVISTIPLGNTLNKICFGVSSDIHEQNNYTMSDFVAKYLFFNFDDSEKDPEAFLGGYEIFSSGAYTWGFANSDLSAVDFSGLGGGNFNFVDGSKSRLEYVESDDHSGIGSVYPGKLFVMDNGPGYGFSVGVTYPATPVLQSQIAGTYKMVTITSHAGESVGYYSIPASGKDVTFYEKYNDGTSYESSQEGTTINSFERVSSLNNIFKMVMTMELEDGTTWQTSAYLILLSGEMMMYFSTEPDGSIGGYGLALKVD